MSNELPGGSAMRNRPGPIWGTPEMSDELIYEWRIKSSVLSSALPHTDQQKKVS